MNKFFRKLFYIFLISFITCYLILLIAFEGINSDHFFISICSLIFGICSTALSSVILKFNIKKSDQILHYLFKILILGFLFSLIIFSNFYFEIGFLRSYAIGIIVAILVKMLIDFEIKILIIKIKPWGLYIIPFSTGIIIGLFSTLFALTRIPDDSILGPARIQGLLYSIIGFSLTSAIWSVIDIKRHVMKNI